MTSVRVFTLIELLVTIAIMGIILTLLLPALSKAKETSRGISCLGNIKQTGLVHHSYAGDFNGFIRNPYIHLGFDHSSGSDWYCYDYLAQQYLGKSSALKCKIFQCPSAAPAITVGTYYGVNAFLFSNFQNGWLYNRIKKVSDLRNPSRSTLSAENNLHTTIDVTASSSLTIMFRHLDKASVIFNDLHAKSCKYKEIPSLVSYPASSYAYLVNTYFWLDALMPGYENITTPGL